MVENERWEKQGKIEAAINVVNAQTASERQVPFITEQARLNTTRFLSQMNREVELGNYIDLNLLFGLEMFSPPQDDLADDNTLDNKVRQSTFCFCLTCSTAAAPE
jgi:hypothetical protein